MRKRTIVKKLTEARGLIEAGWTQHKFKAHHLNYAEDGSGVTVTETFCLLGAVNQVVIGDPYTPTTNKGVKKIEPLTILLSDCLPKDEEKYGIISFNDTPDRTKEEVLAVIDCAIEKVKSG